MMLLLLLGGCVGSVQFPPDLWGNEEWDTGRWDTGGVVVDDTSDTGTTGPNLDVEIDAETIEWGCNPTDVAWILALRTTGWADGATVNFFGATSWTEEHEMLLLDSDSAGAWDEYQLGPLADGTPQEQWQTAINTHFDCETDADTITVVVRLSDRFGDVSDCVIWGDDPSSAGALLDDPAITAIGGCRWLTSL